MPNFLVSIFLNRIWSRLRQHRYICCLSKSTPHYSASQYTKIWTSYLVVKAWDTDQVSHEFLILIEFCNPKNKTCLEDPTFLHAKVKITLILNNTFNIFTVRKFPFWSHTIESLISKQNYSIEKYSF